MIENTVVITGLTELKVSIVKLAMNAYVGDIVSI
jgi:hypothetical protein